MQISQSEPTDSESRVLGNAAVPHAAPSDDAPNRLHHGSGLVTPQIDTLVVPAPVQITLLRGSYVIRQDAVAALGWGDVRAGSKILAIALRALPPPEAIDQPHELVAATLHPQDFVVHPHHVTAIGKGDNDCGAVILSRIVARLLNLAAHQRTMASGVLHLWPTIRAASTRRPIRTRRPGRTRRLPRSILA